MFLSWFLAGFTPLILAATAGHVDVVEILLEHGAEIEAQSERTKDTPLSLACSGGRYEVKQLLCETLCTAYFVYMWRQSRGCSIFVLKKILVICLRLKKE